MVCCACLKEVGTCFYISVWSKGRKKRKRSLVFRESSFIIPSYGTFRNIRKPSEENSLSSDDPIPQYSFPYSSHSFKLTSDHLQTSQQDITVFHIHHSPTTFTYKPDVQQHNRNHHPSPRFHLLHHPRPDARPCHCRRRSILRTFGH